VVNGGVKIPGERFAEKKSTPGMRDQPDAIAVADDATPALGMEMPASTGSMPISGNTF